MSPRTPAAIGDLTGRRAIVTGSNTGLGYRTALALANAGAEVTLAVRSAERGADAVDRIRAGVPAARLRVSIVDLGNQESIREFGRREREQPVDILVNNAGVMLVPTRQTTADGFEKHMGINHLGHFALTGWLLPALTPTARVVTVSSLGHRAAPRLDRNLGLTGGYSPMTAYGQSKLANLLFAVELHRRLRRAGSTAVSVAAHPGWSATELFDKGDEPGIFVRLSRWSTQVLGSSPTAGARPQIHAATSRQVLGGQFIGPSLLVRGAPHPASRSAQARDPEAAKWLWDTSIELTGVRYDGLDS